VHPGNVATSLSRHMSRDDMKAMTGLGTADSEPAAEPPRLEIVPAEQGAATSVWAAVSDELTGLGGPYLTDCAISESAIPTLRILFAPSGFGRYRKYCADHPSRGRARRSSAPLPCVTHDVACACCGTGPSRRPPSAMNSEPVEKLAS
jgi:hypothetical protein